MSTRPTTSAVPYLDLGDGHRIPQLGFGVFGVPPQDTADAVARALATGYRLIDTAAAYRNESGVGEAIRNSGLDRDEVFVTTKLWNNGHGRDGALRAFERSLGRLGLDYVDLYLIHWPVPARDLYVETWQALTEIKAGGGARSIGVSNFTVAHLEQIIETSGQVPAVDQVELHPYFQQTELRRWGAERGILTEAWSPLARAQLLGDPAIREIAERVGRTPAQVVLRWHVQLGNVTIPKSVTPARIEENFQLFDFELAEDEMQAISGLDRDERIGPDPDQFSLT